ncbi:MAG: hypothetical protein AB1757_21230 [Acidobacteriota bacterium]
MRRPDVVAFALAVLDALRAGTAAILRANDRAAWLMFRRWWWSFRSTSIYWRLRWSLKRCKF